LDYNCIIILSNKGLIIKKIYTTRKYKRFNRRRQDKEFRRKNRRGNYHSYIPPISIEVPTNFSFLSNTEESIRFFDNLNQKVGMGYKKILIDLSNIEKITIEVLLYIISLDKKYKKESLNVVLNIILPKGRKLNSTIATSGITQYFLSDKKHISLNEETIFPITDGEMYPNKDDSEICGEAVDFAKKHLGDIESKNPKFMELYNALVELMQNTFDHAYKKNAIISNWYLYAKKVDKGIAFYFFDNGLGIITTARKKFIDKFNIGQKSILESILNGDFRTRTNLPHRGQGFIDIKKLLDSDSVGLQMILTNKVRYFKNEDTHIPLDNLKNNFQGTLVVWLLK
jgi:anti-sigma regulatory factor (Ser/Thr protein kinase)